MRIAAVLVVVLPILCNGQAPTKAPPKSPPKAAQKADSPPPDTKTVQTESIEQLKKQIAELKETVDALNNQFYDQWNDVNKLKRESATFDPAAPDKYTRIETDAGPLLVSLGKVEPYLDGYRVELQVGNPLSITFNGFEVEASWAPRLKNYNGRLAEWFKKQKKQTFSLTQTLVSGRWNSVQLILPETKPEDFGTLTVSVSVNTVSLGTPLSK